MLSGFFEIKADKADKAALLVKALYPSSRVTSKEALELIDSIGADQLERSWKIEKKMAFVNCESQEGVPATIGIQCLIYLFDQGNGWVRDSNKRNDMLIMTAKLVEKGVRLDGISYYGKTIEQYIQDLITDRNSDPSASLNEEIVGIFAAAGYEFSYPLNFSQQSNCLSC